LSVDDVLLLGRIAFVVALYLFLILLAFLLRRELRAQSVMEGERAPADLLVMEPGESGLETGERLALLAQTSIGRDDENDIVLDDTFVSSEHATLIWNGRGWVLKDLGSTNGTRVNNKQIRNNVAVKPGDVLEFGQIRMKLVSV
jgi:hypothetical protein